MSPGLESGSVSSMNRAKRIPVLAGLAAALVGLAACEGVPTVSKAGTIQQAATVIRLQMPDENDPDGLYFAQDVARRSHGALKIVVDSTSYPSTLPANDARLVAALRAGTAGFSYQPARDFAAAGVPAFQALDAPFLVTTVRASEQLAASPLARTVLGQLSSLGLVGIGLIPSEPRQILSTRPLIAPSAFAGIRLRISDNPETAALATALGAQAVQGVSAFQVRGLLLSRSIAGVETSPEYILDNSYNADASYLTSYAVIPKFETIVATRAAWRALTANQRAAIRRAAADTLAHARGVPERESQELAGFCAGGLVLDEPSSAQLAALARETSGAVPASAQVSTMVRMIRAAVPGIAPQSSPIPLPPACRIATTTAQAIALHRLEVPGGSGLRSGVTIPPGTYVTTDTVADWRAGGQTGADWNTSITFTWHLYPDGKVYQTQQPDFPDQPFGRGRYVVRGDEVTFIWDPYMELTPEKVRWSYFGGQLTFSIVQVQDTASRITYIAHPWRKVG
jgi:TRAP-type C4-dicarboxylate transport system substrate-binding protein